MKILHTSDWHIGHAETTALAVVGQVMQLAENSVRLEMLACKMPF